MQFLFALHVFKRHMCFLNSVIVQLNGTSINPCAPQVSILSFHTSNITSLKPIALASQKGLLVFKMPSLAQHTCTITINTQSSLKLQTVLLWA